MKIEHIYLSGQNGFTDVLNSWAEGRGMTVNFIDLKEDILLAKVDAVVVFHENHNLQKEDEDVHGLLVKNNKPGHKIDINGTLAATKSNFAMWIERNKPNSLLVLGANEIIKNPNLQRFLDKL